MLPRLVPLILERREFDVTCARRFVFRPPSCILLVRVLYFSCLLCRRLLILGRIDRIIAGRAVSPKTTSPAPPSGEATPAPTCSSSTPVLKPVYPVTAEMKAKSAALNALTPSDWKTVPLPPGPKSPSSHSPRPPRSPKRACFHLLCLM